MTEQINAFETYNELLTVKKQKVKIELYRDNFQNSKRYAIPKAQLVIADIPYNLGNNAYGFEIDRNFYTGAKEKMLLGYITKSE